MSIPPSLPSEAAGGVDEPRVRISLETTQNPKLCFKNSNAVISIQYHGARPFPQAVCLIST
jgi:hypothetical protein